MTGLGLATISAYLNGKNVRERNRIAIERAIDELGFEVNETARCLRTNKTKTIGIVIPELSNLFATSVITAVEDFFRNHGYATIVCDCRSNLALEQESVNFLLKKRVDGIINIPVSTSGKHLSAAIERKTPVVLVDQRLPGIACDSVIVDNAQATRQATQRLIDAGHRRIGIICGTKGIYTADERLSGYKQALAENQIEIDEKFIAYGNYTIEGGDECLKHLAGNKDMTAVLISNYEMTIGAVIALNELRLKIPDDISVIGFDNIDFAMAVTPALSIITQPVAKIGENAARILMERLDGRSDEPHCLELKSFFIDSGTSIRKITAGR